jgi:hypothetical protein
MRAPIPAAGIAAHTLRIYFASAGTSMIW